jgi:eukaryotic-like serine/threonine-protein kinase
MKSLQSLRRRCRVCGDIFNDSVTSCPIDGGDLSDLSRGLELFGPYEYLSVLGEGGMGIIYKARHKVIDKTVAIKMLRPGRLTSDDIRRFQKEGRAISRLHHPGIVEVHDLGLTPEGLPFMVMDFIDGISLKHLIESHGALSLSAVMDIAHQIASAMAHAHEQGVIHRDLKSSNIMLVETGCDCYQVKIVDFGIAKIDHPDLASGHTLTTTGEVFGSPAYMSPEQARGEKVGASTDIYSTGCIIFESLTGATPFQGPTVFDVVLRHLNEAPPALEEASLGRKFPASVSNLVQMMLAKDPAQRPPNFAAVCDLLAAVQAGQFEVPEPIDGSVTARFVKTIKSRTPLVVVIAGLIVVGAIFALMSFKSIALTEKRDDSGDDIARLKKQVEVQLGGDGKKSVQEPGHASDSNPIILPYDLGGPLKSAQTLIELCFKHDGGCAGLGNIQLTDEVLQYLSRQRRLLGLSLVGNPIGDRLFDYIKDLPLHSLSLNGTNVTDKGLVSASNMITLEDIDLTRLNSRRHGGKKGEKPIKVLTGKGLSALCRLPHLKDLRLLDDWLTDADLECLPSMKHLTDLDLSGCQHVTGKACDYIGGIQNLQTLSMENGTVPLSDLTQMKNFPQLHVLYLGGNQAVRAQDMPEFVKRGGHLEFLDLSDTPIAAPYVRELANLTDLTTLSLRHCTKLLKADVDFLKQRLPGCHIDSDYESGGM